MLLMIDNYDSFTFNLYQYLAEVNSAPPLVVHAICAALLLGRCAHAYGVSQPQEDFRFRVAGMAMTFGALISSAIAILLLRLI